MKLIRVHFSAAQQEVEVAGSGINSHISHRNGYVLFCFSFQLRKNTELHSCVYIPSKYVHVNCEFLWLY